MGFLKRLLFGYRPAVQLLPTGSMIVDRDGKIVTATVASIYPPALLREIAAAVLTLFREARTAEMPLAELSLHFASLRITAREQRGGAIIFLSPPSPFIHATKPT